MMIFINEKDLILATERLVVAALSATDVNGLKVHVNLPRDPLVMRTGTADSDVNCLVSYDYSRCQAIALAAVVALTGHPCDVQTEDSVPISYLTLSDLKKGSQT